MARVFATMAPHLYLLTRTHTDFGAPMLDLVAESGVYDAGERPFEDARRSAEDVHYEVLLRSRIASS